MDFYQDDECGVVGNVTNAQARLPATEYLSQAVHVAGGVRLADMGQKI